MEGRWEPMFQAPEMLNQDRPIIILGMFSPQGLLYAVVK